MEINTIFKNIIPIQVRFNDVDIIGHVSNTVYLNYYDSGKVSYFNEVMPDLDFINTGFVGAKITIDYLKPIYMKTKILVTTRVSILGHKSITMDHLLLDELQQDILSTCSAVLVCYDIKALKSIIVPQHWRQKILEYDENVVVKY